MLLMLALALPMIGQTTTYTYQKSKGKSTRPLQTDTTYGYQKQVTHEDRVVIYRKPSSDSITLWRNAEAFFSYARWYDYTTDQFIPNITLWRSSDGTNNSNTSGTQSNTCPTQNNGVIWYCNEVNDKNQYLGRKFQANAKYVYNPTSTENQVVFIACDQSSYTDWSIVNDTFTEPTISQRMVFEIRPASEMADRVEACTEGKWLEEYNIMAPTGQNIFIGPKYAFKDEQIKSGNNKNVTVGQSYPAYFYKDSNGDVQAMGNSNISDKPYSSTIGTWENVGSKKDTTTRYICDSSYSINTITWNLQASNFSNPSSTNIDSIVGDVIIDGLTWHYKREFYDKNKTNNTITSINNYVQFGSQSSTGETVTLSANIPQGVTLQNVYVDCYSLVDNDKDYHKLHIYKNDETNKKNEFKVTNGKKAAEGIVLSSEATVYSISEKDLPDNTLTKIILKFKAETTACELFVKSIKLNVKDSNTGNALTGTMPDTTEVEPNALVARFWRKQVCVTEIDTWKKVEEFVSGGQGWLWYVDGQPVTPTIISGQFIEVGVQSDTTTKTYQLLYSTNATNCETTYYKRDTIFTITDSVTNGGTWERKGDPKVISVSTNLQPNTVYPNNNNNKIYKIAQFKVKYFDKSIVGPVSQKMGDFVNNMEIIAEQNFNFGYNENNKLPITDKVTRFYWATPLSEEESTYGFYYGSADRCHRDNTRFPNCYYNEYCFINNGEGHTKNDSVANHVGNGKGYDKETGYALYADGSQKAGTVFSIDFGADLCPGAKMYFSAWIGDQNMTTDSKYVKGFPIFNFYVEGIDEAGNAHTLATFTIGEFKQQNNGWHYILFPIEFGDDIDYEKFTFRIENMAASTEFNDFFLDDVRVYLQRAAISPIQASISNDASCLNKKGQMTLYTRVDCYTDQVDLEITGNDSLTFYYRWYDKKGAPVDCNYMGRPKDLIGLPAYGKVTIPRYAANIQSKDKVISFNDFDATYNSSSNPIYKFINEQCLNPDLSVENRYVVYVATPVPVELGQSYRCILANAAGSLPDKAGAVTGREKCTSDAIVQIVHGLCIRSEKLGGFVTDDSQANANVSYELSLVSESITHKEGIANKNVSCYFAYWLFGRDTIPGEYNAQNKIEELKALYGTSYQNVEKAIIDYIDNKADDTQKAIVNRLVSMGALRLSNTTQLSDTSFLVLPLYTSDTISYTVFPVWDYGGTLTKCHNPLTISLYFQKSIPIEGEEGEQQTFVRNAISFVKSADETLPTFMHNLRARRVRIPRDSVQKYVQLKMTDTTSHYTVKHATLIETTNTNTTATEPLFKRINSWVDTEDVKDMTGNGPYQVRFKDLNQLPEGYSYTFRMDYDIHDVNTQLDTTYNGEAFITFMVVPNVLFYNGTYNDGWNDDSKWKYKDLTTKKFVESMVPLHSTKIVVTGNNNRKLAVKPAVKTENNVQLLPVETNAQPYITYDIGYEPYACSEVFLYGEYHAVLGQHYLHTIDENGDTIPPKWTYEAWPNQKNSGWKFFSVPIKGVVLGDMFVPAKYESSDNYRKDNNTSDPNELFSVSPISQEPGTAADDRTVYSFYNSMYNKATEQYLGNGNTKDITTSTWTYATNALDREITAGFGWALGLMISAEVDPNKIVLIRLPKNDTEYHYFRNDTWVGESVRIDRTEDLGRPMLELDEKDNMVIRLENYESSKYFLFGNPTFASIDLERLKKANSSIQAFYQTTIDKANRYLLASAQNPENNTWYTNLTTAKAVTGTLPTGEACFIVLNEPAETVDITINPQMLRNSDGSKKYDGYGNPWETVYPQSSSSAAPAAYTDTVTFEPSAIYITATLDSFMSSTSIIDAPDAELELFMLDREKTPFAIYTVADNKALSINHIREGQSRIPLAMYAEKPVNQPLFAFEGEPRDIVEWDLVDIKTGVRQPLYEGLTMRLNMPQDGSVRYYLERSRHGIYTSESKTDAFQTYAYGGMLTIYSEEPLYDLRIYDPAGRLLCMEADAGTSYTATLTAGTYIIRASGSTCKVIVP